MPHYRYRALSPQLRSISGQLWALDSQHAQELLQDQGLQRIFLRAPSAWENWWERHRPASDQEQALICKQMATMLASGVPILTCMDIVLRQPMHLKLYEGYRHCLLGLQQGQGLAECMRECRGLFDDFYVGLIQVGEATGGLTESLEEISQHMERDLLLRAKVTSALTYPLIVSTLSFGLAYVMVQHILPRFINGLFAGQELSLPWVTRLLVYGTNFLQRPGMTLGLLLLLLGGGWMLAQHLASPAGSRQFYEQAMRWKWSREFLGKIMAVRAARMLSSGVEAGLTVADSLELTAQACGNGYLKGYLEIALEDLRDGATLGSCLKAIPFVPPVMCGFVELGEEVTGLPSALRKSAEILEQDVEGLIESSTQLLEPLLVGAMGLFVGLVLVALFIPIYQMMGSN